MQGPEHSSSVMREKPADKPGSSLIHVTDLWLALIILAVTAGLYYATTRFENVSQLLAQNIPPEFFPRLLLWTIVVFTLLLPFEHRFHERGKKHLDEDRRHRIKPMAVVTACLLALVVASMQWLGTFLAMVLLCVSLPMLWGERRLKILLPFALIFPSAVAVLFTQALKVYFEPGILDLVLR